MAKLERVLQGDFDQILRHLEAGILDQSLSASIEDSSDFQENDARCSVRVFERYSMIGSNRLSLSVTLFQAKEDIHLSAISSGGSQAVLFKLNTWGEDAFLDVLEGILDSLPSSVEQP